MKTNRLLVILVLAGAFAACSKTVEVPATVGSVPIGMGVVNGRSTKAPVTGTAMPTSRHIVFSTYYNAAEGSSGNYFTGIDFTYKGEGTLWTAGKYWPLSGTLDFLGYSLDNNSRVSSVSWGSNNTASVTMTLADNNANQDDLLVGGASALTSASNAVVMKHAQALLMCRAKSNVAYNAGTNYGITITDIKFNSTKHSGTVACTRTGGNIAFAWSSLGSSMNKSLPSMSATNLTTTFANINGTSGLMLPSQTETSITIYYTLHNGFASDGTTPVNNTLQYTWTPGSPIIWQPGKRYTYDIDMSLTQITVNASVTDWDDENQGILIPDPANGHSYVDLGLRSGGNKILFATMNIGASSPEEYGDYFAWGETSKRYTSISGNSVVGGSFEWSNCPYHTGSTHYTGWSKYIPTGKGSYSESGVADNKLTLEAGDDVASVIWGGNWRMPDNSDLEYLISSNVTYSWTNDYNGTGVHGCIITGKGSFSSASLFLPAAGFCGGSDLYDAGDFGFYWSRSVFSGRPYYAWNLCFEGGAQYMGYNNRCDGRSVRPVLILPDE